MTIEIDNLDLTIQGHKILKSVRFDVSKGETVVLLGKNGSGKTMLLKSIIGLYPPSSGTIKVFEKDINKLSKEDRIDLFKKTGYVFQKSGLFDSLSTAENVMFAIKRFNPQPKNIMLEKAIELLRSTGLENVENKLPSELSGGMQKRAGIARAIAMDPTLLLMDDPTAGLDPVLSDAIAELIIKIKERLGSTVIIVTHDLKIGLKLADKIGLMHEGEMLQYMSKDDFISTNDPFVVQFRTGNLKGPIPVIDGQL